jgi:signal transduction histidine kinase/ActR/RegA family two-component response regulator/PAS domain-containing protein
MTDAAPGCERDQKDTRLEAWLSGGGEMGTLVRSMDWNKTRLGPIESWPQSLRTAVSICLGSRHPIALWWGPERTMFYNDAYRPMLGESKHPQFLGRSGQECWAEIWHLIGPMMDQVIATGEATWSEDLFLPMFRSGYLEETYFTFSYSPIRDEMGRPSGIFNACTESTARVLGERRLKMLREMVVEARAANEAARLCAEILGHNPRDIPFALVYLLDDAGKHLHLAGQVGLEPGTPTSPFVVAMAEPDTAGWPLARVAAHGCPETVEDLAGRFDYRLVSPWGEPAHQAMLLPIAHPGRRQSAGVLVLGISPRRAFDDDYRGFFGLVAGHVATVVTNARTYEEERKRTEERVTWLASFPERNPNPIIELEWTSGRVDYVNPSATRLFPDLQSQGLRHPWLAGLREAATVLVDGTRATVHREVMVGEFCYAQTLHYLPEAQRLRVYSSDITERKLAEDKVQAHVARLELLNHITRAIGERQDLRSIFQIMLRSVEENLPVDFGCLCLYDQARQQLTVTQVGVGSQSLALELALPEQAPIPVDQNGLTRCVRGQLVYEPDIAEARLPFPQKLAGAGLRAFVAAPLLVESKVFGVLLAARRQAHGFSSGECESLRQVSEHVALAAHQAQLYSALQQAYDDLRHTQQAVLQQERLRALGQMASGIAHDINNAISPIALYTESLLERESTLSTRAREYLVTMQRAIEDVGHTIARMREFYRQREPQLILIPVDLTRLLPQVVDLTRARWSDMPQQRGVVIDLRTDLAPDLPAIMGIESELREALINLIFNAVDAMPEGGMLTLRTRAVTENTRGDASTQVEVEVCDTGVGMDEETRRRCLEPFFTTKGERGTGLGLAMVYGIVQRHSAELEIESVVGQGTTMRLVFAAAVAEEPALPMAHAQVPARLRLLIVDDDPLLLKSLQDTLEGDGHVVVAANGGQNGIEMFEAAVRRGEGFAAVITDLGMPYVDGRRVAMAIKTAATTTPIILLTGWGQRLEAEGDVPLHVDRVLSKPPKLRELRAALVELTDNVTQTGRL